MSGASSGLQARLKEPFPHTHFGHCYGHQLNIIMIQACSSHTPVRVFFANVFSKSPKRTAVLDEEDPSVRTDKVEL